MTNELQVVEKWLLDLRNETDIHKILNIRDNAAAMAVFAKTRGSAKLADKVKEVQIRSEIHAGNWLIENGPKHGGDRRSSSQNENLKLEDLGINHNESYRWQKIARGYNENTNQFERVIAELLEDEEQELTRAGVMRKAWMAILNSDEIEWWTPKIYIDAVYEVMGEIDLDPASSKEANKTIKAKKIYTKSDDGLIQNWFGKVFLNPPYGQLGPEFAEKLYNEYGSSVDEAIMLVNSRATDANWFQPCFEGVICFTDHRIDFDSPEEKQTSSTHGSCFVYFGPNEEKFAEVFSKFGNVVKRYEKSEVIS